MQGLPFLMIRNLRFNPTISEKLASIYSEIVLFFFFGYKISTDLSVHKGSFTSSHKKLGGCLIKEGCLSKLWMLSCQLCISVHCEWGNT